MCKLFFPFQEELISLVQLRRSPFVASRLLNEPASYGRLFCIAFLVGLIDESKFVLTKGVTYGYINIYVWPIYRSTLPVTTSPSSVYASALNLSLFTRTKWTSRGLWTNAPEWTELCSHFISKKASGTALYTLVPPMRSYAYSASKMLLPTTTSERVFIVK